MPKLKSELARLSLRYATALRKHLRKGSRTSLQTALRLGSDALALGLGRLELARIHEKAFIVIDPTSRKQAIIKRAENFFTKASTRMMEVHHGGPLHKMTLKRLKHMTSRRAAELKTTNRELQQSIVQRKAKENEFQQNGKHQNKCLGEALELQKSLRRGSHRVLAAQEDQRKKISHELQDEIAQTLVGINVRLLSLRMKARSKFKGIKNEIASTQRLVVESAKSVRRFARKLNNYQDEQSNRSDTTP
jgi:signal transduction histidine kinase